MKIGNVVVSPPLALAPMAGMTDTAFRRLVKRKGGCGLVVTEMVSSEGLVRGIDRTLEYAEYTEEERPVSIQIFGGDPGEDGRGGQDRRRHGRRHRRRQHGLSRAQDRQAQRRVLADARTVARAVNRARDDRRRQDPCDGEDARRLERARDQRAGRWRGAWRTPAPRRLPFTGVRPSSPTAGRATGSSSRRWRAASAFRFSDRATALRRAGSGSAARGHGPGRARGTRCAQEPVDLQSGAGTALR